MKCSATSTLALMIAGAISPSQADTQRMPTINVFAPALANSIEQSLTKETLMSPASDGGAAMTQLPGVTAARMGGKGLDPVIRGQSQNRLNILLDGAYIYSACPNRMDPPTTYANLEAYDQVTVIKGSRSVLHGPGGNGGTVLFERSRPEFYDKKWNAKLSTGYIGNSDTRNYSADVAAGNDQGYFRLISDYSKAGNYQDGDGNTVRSSYTSETNSLLAGFKLTEHTWLEASYDQANEEDLLFAGAGMDSPYSDSDTWRLKLDHAPQNSTFTRIQAEVYRSEINHLMDNYSLRTPAMMRMKSFVFSDTKGGRLQLDNQLGAHLVQWGADYQNNHRTRGEVSQTGLFAQTEHALNMTDNLSVGIRLDWVEAEATDSTVPDANERNVSGFLNWNHILSEHYVVDTTFSRSVRTADTVERYQDTARQQGSPNLNPEVQHQFEVALNAEYGQLSWSLAAYYNRIDDFIEQYSDSGISRFSNIDAAIYGVDADLNWTLNNQWGIDAGLNWLRGKDRTNSQNLSQIPPLSAQLGINFEQGPWRANGQWLLVAKQRDICLSSSDCQGMDLQKTPGHGVVNLGLSYQVSSNFSIRTGVDNLLDQMYSNHLNYADQIGSSVQVAEPGRTAWIKLVGEF